MKNFILCLLISFVSVFNSYADTVTDTLTALKLKEVTVTSLYRNNVQTGSMINTSTIKMMNHGQGADYVLSTLPNIYAYNDNGTQMGYCYFRMRGMGQERMNVTLDGMPWNEAEDFGCYFSNSPDLMSSLHSIKVEKGASVTNNGTAAYAGNVSLESVDLRKDTDSWFDIGYGSFNSSRVSGVYNMGLKNHWGLHIRATSQQTDGYKENTYNNSKSITLKTGYFFNDKHSLDFLTMTGYHRNGQGFMGLTEDMIPKHPTPFKQMKSGNRQQETDDFLTTYNRFQYKGILSDKVFLSSSLYWQHQTGNYRIGWDDPSRPTGSVLNNYHLNYNLTGFNTVIKYYPVNNLSLTTGVNAYIYHRRHKGYDIANSDSIITAWKNPGLTPYYDNAGTKPDVNVFANVKYQPINKFTIDAALQYRYTSLHYRVNTPAIGINGDSDFNHDWNFMNYSFGLTYDIDKYSKVYARYAVTNREPSRTDMFGGEYRTDESEMNTQSERVHDVELGYEIRNNKINFNINGFYMNFSNELVATGELSSMNGLPLHKQHDSYRLGLELAMDYNPVNTLHLIANASWSENKLKNINGNEMNHTFSPSSTLFAEANYSVNKIKFGVNTNFRSSMYMDIYNNHQLKENLTLNAYVNARVSKIVELSLNLNNITNRLNFSNGSVDIPSDTAYYLVDSPFNMFATAKFHF